MSLIINSLDFGNNVLSFQQVIKPSYTMTSIASKRLAKIHDYGTLYDRYFSEIDLIVTDSEYVNLTSLIGQSLNLTSSLDLFFPSLTFPANTQVGITSIEESGWYAEGNYTSRVVRLTLKLLIEVISTGSLAEVQGLINRGYIDRMDDLGLHSPDIVGTGYQLSRLIPCKQFTISHDMLTQYQAGQIIGYLLTQRATPSSVTLSARHGVTGTKDVFLTDFRLKRNENGRYMVSIVVTVA